MVPCSACSAVHCRVAGRRPWLPLAKPLPMDPSSTCCYLSSFLFCLFFFAPRSNIQCSNSFLLYHSIVCASKHELELDVLSNSNYQLHAHPNSYNGIVGQFHFHSELEFLPNSIPPLEYLHPNTALNKCTVSYHRSTNLSCFAHITY